MLTAAVMLLVAAARPENGSRICARADLVRVLGVAPDGRFVLVEVEIGDADGRYESSIGLCASDFDAR